MLALDLGVFNRKAHEVQFKEALTWSCVWVAPRADLQRLDLLRVRLAEGARVPDRLPIEKALSVDNIFVFVVLFASFAVPKIYQHRVLFWGVIGAHRHARHLHRPRRGADLALPLGHVRLRRASCIFTGIKLLLQGDDHEPHPEKNPIYKLARPAHAGRRRVPRQGTSRSSRTARGYATPLLLVLIAIEATDVVFAVDSIPAIFAITTDPFIVYTSNIFAILGLRAHVLPARGRHRQVPLPQDRPGARARCSSA